MTKLKSTQVAPTRAQIAAEQGGKCAICKAVIFRPCLDHNHTTGAVRGVLCSGCNSLLGKIENNAGRFGVRNLVAWCAGVPAYLMKHAVNVTGLIHPLHKTEDEKRIARNAKARATRAKKKES